MGKAFSLAEMAEKWKKYGSFAVFCHVRPDGDTIGSAIALREYLLATGKKADLFCSDVIPDSFRFFKPTEDFRTEITAKYDAFVAVDCASADRLGDLASAFLNAENTFNIDHHVSNERYAKYNFVRDRAANCENIYELFTLSATALSATAARALLLGISTDTGNFAHKNVTGNTLRVAGALVDAGADLNLISYEMFKRQSKARAKLFGNVVSKIRYALSGTLAIAVITTADLSAAGAKPSETEGIIDFVLSIDGVGVAASVLETGDLRYKISFRSKKTDVNGVAGMFGGGGHTLASGCMIAGYLEDVIDKITFAVSRFTEE